VPEIPIDDLDAASPVYESVEGWSEDITGARDVSDLPSRARRYLSRIESWLGVPVAIASVGAERNETILARNPFRD
jgi:adenylosuccinate synthase